jgi:hypothetical protein
MKCVLAVAMTAALALTASTAPAAAKDHKRSERHARAPAVVAPEPWRGFDPRITTPRPYGCVQDEGYGRWTVCGQGPP